MEADSDIRVGGNLSGHTVPDSRRSRRRLVVRAAACLGFMLLATAPAVAGGLPMRPTEAKDPALAMLAEGLDFKLARLDGGPIGAWAAAVEEVLLVARRLGFPAESGVTAERVDDSFVVLWDDEGYIAGADPDAVLGRLLYQLAHAGQTPAWQRPAAALAILDQPLSATLAALPSSVP